MAATTEGSVSGRDFAPDNRQIAYWYEKGRKCVARLTPHLAQAFKVGIGVAVCAATAVTGTEYLSEDETEYEAPIDANAAEHAESDREPDP